MRSFAILLRNGNFKLTHDQGAQLSGCRPGSAPQCSTSPQFLCPADPAILYELADKALDEAEEAGTALRDRPIASCASARIDIQYFY
jgi:hypothetical protein